MKKFWIFGLMMILLLCGCTNEIGKQTENPQQTQPVEDTRKIVGNQMLKDCVDWEVMAEYEIDVTNDGNDDTVKLFTSAKRNKKGEMMWDDTQEWVLRVEHSDGKMSDLYDERIHGTVYLNIADAYHDGTDERIVSLHIFGNSFNEVREYVYNGTNFLEDRVYSTDEYATEGINLIYSSVPAYE